MKECKTCGKTKPYVEYHRNRSQPDGFSFYCRRCLSEQNKKRYADPAHREKLKAKARIWRVKNPDKVKVLNDRNREKIKQWRFDNPEKYAAKKKMWRAANEDHLKKEGRRRALRNNFGITPEHFERLLGWSNGGCAICGKKPHGEKAFAVDHNHDTGGLRGVLCHDCNVGLGFFKDNLVLLRNAMSYLTYFQ